MDEVRNNGVNGIRAECNKPNVQNCFTVNHEQQRAYEGDTHRASHHQENNSVREHADDKLKDHVKRGHFVVRNNEVSAITLKEYTSIVRHTGARSC